jgi:hypothetical protein
MQCRLQLDDLVCAMLTAAAAAEPRRLVAARPKR